MKGILNICAYGFILAPILVVLIYNVFNHNFARRHFVWFAGAGTIWQMLSSVLGYAAMRRAELSAYDFSVLWDYHREGAAYFQLTGPKFLFLFVIGLVGFVSVLLANRTIAANRSSYTNLLMIITLAMNGMLVVTDLFTMYVFMEIIGLCCFVMIAMFRSRKGLEGSFKYLVMSELAGIFILVGLSFIFMKTGSLRFDELGSFLNGNADTLQNILGYFALVLLISGFALKSGAAPFHSWLPDAYQSADTAVTVLLSGVVFKIAGIYGLMAVSELFGALKPIRVSLAVLGIASILLGALLANRQKNVKRLLAYSSVSQMGYIMLGVSTGTQLGTIAALAHTFSHAVFKSTLFSNAVALEEQTGSLEMDDLGGLEKAMPVTSFTSLIAFFSTSGIPPLAGFWSKLLVLLALWQAGQPVLAGVALAASIFTGAYMLRLQSKVFFGKPRPELAEVKDIRGSVRASEILTTIITIGSGLCFPLLLLYLHARGVI